MDTQQTATSGVDSATSGAGQVNSETVNDQSQATSGVSDSEGAGSHPQTFVDKLRKEKENTTRKNVELQEQLAALQQQIVEAKESDLQKNEQYKELWTQEQEKRKVAEESFNSLQSKVTDGKKMSAIRDELLKRGLNPEHEKSAFRLMDTDQVMIDPDTGAIIGADDAAKDFHEQFKSLGFFGHPVPGVSHQATSNNNKPLIKDVSQMSKEEIQAELNKLK